MTSPSPELTIAHSPDPDDAFMWWPLGAPGRAPAIDTEGLSFVPVMEDIEALNRRAVERGDLDITAISVHTYAHVRERYALTSCGASMGRAYGPRVVSASARDESWLASADPLVAIPGRRTSAYLALRLMLGKDVRVVEVAFDEVAQVVASGRVDAGVVIHEAQLTYAQHGLHLVVDLGAWWTGLTGLPLPLGANAVRLDLEERLGAGGLARVTRVLDRSVRHAMAHREDALAVASKHACDPSASAAQVETFVDMYVNDLTRDAGEEGTRAIERLLTMAHEQGLCPDPSPIRVVRPGAGG